MAATEQQMLEALCAQQDKLTDDEAEAFPQMLARLKAGQQKKLTSAQRGWVESRYFRYDLDADEPAENLVSSGKVAPTSVVLPYERLARPLKPPGKQ